MSTQIKLTPSSRRLACPICGRTADGDCRIADELVLCHYGSRHHPPTGLRAGDVIPGNDGLQWALTGDTSDGRAATYTLHKPRSESHRPQRPIRGTDQPSPLRLAQLPKSAGEPPAHMPDGARINYSEMQWVIVERSVSDKRHIPHHRAANGQAQRGAGDQPWPLWRQADATRYGVGKWIAEAEGEKCGAWLRAGGVVAVSQPGHDHKQANIQRRYQQLKDDGISGVIYLADHDKTGREKGERCAAAAAAVGLQLVVVHASDVWPDLRPGGSIDDAPGTAAERVAALLAAIPAAVERHQQQQRVAVVALVLQENKPKREHKARKLTHTTAMACFDRCVEVQAQRERNSLRRRARLLKAAKDLGLKEYLNRQEIAQRVLEAKARHHGQAFKALTAADRAVMARPVVQWLLPGLIPAGDLTIVGGRPKVGKTRLAVAMAAAVIRGESFLNSAAPATTVPVVLVTDDQADHDSATMLEALGLWDSPLLIWSRNFRLTENDLDGLLATVKANPGALVIIDSLRSSSRSLQHGENDPEIGATLYDLKQAVIDAGGTLMLIHHCNKAADLVGVEALSGHNAIAGAANTVITLHYCPDAKDRPDKQNPQRRMFCEARSGDGCDVVIDRAGSGTYRLVSSFSQWQQQLEQARKHQKRSNELTPTQQGLIDLLEANPDTPFTRRELVERLGFKWDGGKSADATRVRESLEKLVGAQLIDKKRIGREFVFLVSREAPNQPSLTSSSFAFSNSKGSEGEVLEGHDLSLLSIQSAQAILNPKYVPTTAIDQAQGEDGEIGASPYDPLIRQEAEQGEEGEDARRRAGLIPDFVVASQPPTGSSWDCGDGDDPACGPRPEVA